MVPTSAQASSEAAREQKMEGVCPDSHEPTRSWQGEKAWAAIGHTVMHGESVAREKCEQRGVALEGPWV